MCSDKLFHRGWGGKFFYDSKNTYFNHNKGVNLWYLQKLAFDSVEYLRIFFFLSPKERAKRYNLFIINLIQLLKILEFKINWYIYKIYTLENGLRVIFRVEWDDLEDEKKRKEVLILLDHIQPLRTN